MQILDLHPSLSTWLDSFETRLALLFEGEYALLHDASLNVVKSRGKRLRPIVLFLSCVSFGEVKERAISSGCLVELIHTASLVHDDVVDEADTRRGELSARARWGNKLSLLLGDFLLARVFELATEDGDPAVCKLLAPITVEMGRGVILELTSMNIDASIHTYWQAVNGKTATLFSASFALGALVGGASTEQQQMMAAAGEAFGCAFQLADDLMDLQGAEETIGKPLRIDWQQRRATFPLLYALQHATPDMADQIRSLWNHEPFSKEQFKTLSYLVESAGGFECGWKTVKNYLDKACVCLNSLPQSDGRDALLCLCQERFPLPVLPTAT